MTGREDGVLTEAIGDEPLGDHVLELQIAECRRRNRRGARLLVFAVPDGSTTPEIPPGAFAPRPLDAARAQRAYRLVALPLCSPPLHDALAVTVKRTAAGYASTTADHAQVGMRIHVGPRRATSSPQPRRRFLLLAAVAASPPISVDLQIGACRGRWDR